VLAKFFAGDSVRKDLVMFRMPSDQVLEKLRTNIVQRYRNLKRCPPPEEIQAYASGALSDETRRQRVEQHLATNCLLCKADLQYGPDSLREKRGRDNLRKLLKSLFFLTFLNFILRKISNPREGARKSKEEQKPRNFLPSGLSPAPFVAFIMVGALAVAAGLSLIRNNSAPHSATLDLTLCQNCDGNPLPFGDPFASARAWPVSVAYVPPPRHTAYDLRKPILLPLFATTTGMRPAAPAKQHGGSALIFIKKLGEIAVTAETLSNPATLDAVPYPVHRQEIVTLQVTGHMSPAARIYPLLRADGEPWLVEGGVRVPSSRGGELKVPVQFGPQDAELAAFDCRFLADAENLPAERVSDEVLNGTGVLGTSGILRVKRRSATTPIVAITHVNGIDNYGGLDLAWVEDEAPIRVSATKLPIDSRIGIVIQPVRPLNDKRWVQMDDLTSSGEINGHFGDPMYHQFHRFAITSFLVGALKDFPPRGVPIDAIEWESYRKKFLATSTPVVVIKAGDYFSIDSIGNRKPSETSYIPIDTQEDISGSLDRPLASGERIWIICLPSDANDSWIATPVSAIRDSNWTAKAVRFWNGHSKRFKIVAAISTEDVTKKPPQELRSWINTVPHSVNAVNAQIRFSRIN
jgi:hypothetical protein